MVRAVRTKYEVVRWTAMQTLLALGLVLPATAFGVFWLYGGDLSNSVSGYAAMVFCLAFAAVETLIIGPTVAIRSGKMLRQLNLARDEVVRLAHVDPLTGLLNRRGFDKVAAAIFADRDAMGRSAAALICDLDHFKSVNDEFGHEFGDAALRHVADILREATIGKKAVLGRMGGDEFVLLLQAVTRPDALAVADIVRLSVATLPVEWHGEKVWITMSIGFTATPSGEGGVSPLIARADAALYKAKRDGRNRVAVAPDFPLEAAEPKFVFEMAIGSDPTDPQRIYP
jgi:diguanylate cyclase (GGDEF)-like protein